MKIPTDKVLHFILALILAILVSIVIANAIYNLMPNNPGHRLWGRRQQGRVDSNQRAWRHGRFQDSKITAKSLSHHVTRTNRSLRVVHSHDTLPNGLHQRHRYSGLNQCHLLQDRKKVAVSGLHGDRRNTRPCASAQCHTRQLSVRGILHCRLNLVCSIGTGIP